MASKVEITRNGRIVSEAEAQRALAAIVGERVRVQYLGGKGWIAHTDELTPEINDAPQGEGYSVRFLGRV